MKMSWKLILLYFVLFMNARAEMYEDNRCRCVCPTTITFSNGTQKLIKTLYIAIVPPNKCNCHGVILPKVSDELKLNAWLFCPRCECKYESRNTVTIMVVVMFVMWLIMILISYYSFLILLEFSPSGKLSFERMRPTSDEDENLLHEDEEMEEF